MQAENAFRIGTEWHVQDYFKKFNGEYVTTETVNQIFKILGSKEFGDYTGLLLVGTSENATEDILLEVYLRTEGDKVYFLFDEDTNDWRLAYDFGLQPGEECEVYEIESVKFPGLARKTVMRCVERTVDPKYNDYPCMIMESSGPEVDEFSQDPELRETTWLVGVGDWRGVVVTNQVYLDSDGGSLLEKVTNGDEVICERTTANVETLEAAELQVRVNGLTVEFDGHGTLYAPDGRTVADGCCRLTAPAPGVYILTTAAGSAKFSLR